MIETLIIINRYLKREISNLFIFIFFSFIISNVNIFLIYLESRY